MFGKKIVDINSKIWILNFVSHYIILTFNDEKAACKPFTGRFFIVQIHSEAIPIYLTPTPCPKLLNTPSQCSKSSSPRSGQCLTLGWRAMCEHLCGMFFAVYHSGGTAIDSSVLQCVINSAAMLKQASQCWMLGCVCNLMFALLECKF